MWVSASEKEGRLAGVTRILLASPSHPGLQSSPAPRRRAAALTMLWLFFFSFFPKITGQIMRLIRNTRRSQCGGKRSGGGWGGRSDTLRAVNRYGGGRKLGQRRSAGLGGEQRSARRLRETNRCSRPHWAASPSPRVPAY